MRKTLLFVLACIIGVTISGCVDYSYTEGIAYQYARSLGLTGVRTSSIASDKMLCNGALTVGWSDNKGRGGIICIKDGTATPLQS